MNKALLLGVLLFLLFIHGSLSGKIQFSPNNEWNVKTEAQIFFDSISLKNRERFITYYLAKGQGLEQEILSQENNAEIFVDLKEPLNFSENLFQWTKTKFSLEDEQISELTKRKEVCLSNGWCLKVIDVGSICCPF